MVQIVGPDRGSPTARMVRQPPGGYHGGAHPGAGEYTGPTWVRAR
jgi:hypothetical protein